MEPYKVFHEEYMGDKSEEIMAYSHQHAAQDYARWYNTRADYVLLHEEASVRVEDIEGVSKNFTIYAEPDISYEAEEIVPKQKPLEDKDLTF